MPNSTSGPRTFADRDHPNGIPADVELLPWAADHLGVSLSTAYRLAAEGKIPGLFRVGTQYPDKRAEVPPRSSWGGRVTARRGGAGSTSPSVRPRGRWHDRTTRSEVLLQCDVCGQKVTGEVELRGRLTFQAIAGVAPASEVAWKSYSEAEAHGRRKEANEAMWQYRHIVRDDPERHIHLRDGGTLVAYRPDGGAP